MSESGYGVGMLTGILVGAAVGAGLALMYAPCSGKDTREWLARKSRELKTRGENVYEQTKAALKSDGKDLVSVRAQGAPPYGPGNNKARA
jgi:gas vesicle protein